MERLQDEFGADIVVSHLNAWQFVSSALVSEKDGDILFRVNLPGAASRRPPSQARDFEEIKPQRT